MARHFGSHDVLPHTSATLDITDAAAVRDAVAVARPDVIVNCAAFNDVDGAESAPQAAFAVNAFGVRSLARAAEDTGARLVHFSTDFVFDGTASVPYDESVSPSPRSAYAASKLVGEWFALDAPAAYVLRVESLFGAPYGWRGRRGTLETLLDRLEQGETVRVFVDRVVSPGYTADIAAATSHLLETGAPAGVYHCVNSGAATWEAVVRRAAAIAGLPPRLEPVRMADVPLRAARPQYCALATTKLAGAGFPMPSWEDALERWIPVRRGAAPGGPSGTVQ